MYVGAFVGCDHQPWVVEGSLHALPNWALLVRASVVAPVVGTSQMKGSILVLVSS